MTLETRPFDPVNYLKTPEDMIAYVEAMFEEGNAADLSAALDDVARALGRTDLDAASFSDDTSVMRKLKSLGFGLTLKAA